MTDLERLKEKFERNCDESKSHNMILLPSKNMNEEMSLEKNSNLFYATNIAAEANDTDSVATTL